MKYVVINVYDRVILNIGTADTLIEAKEIMKNDFMHVLKEHSPDNWQLDETTAWLNGRMNFNWQIIEVE